MGNNLDRREDMIGNLYEVVLDPEKMNDFIALWDKYLTDTVKSATRDTPASLVNESQIISADFESHFSRVYEMLDRVSATPSGDRADEMFGRFGHTCVFGGDGTLKERIQNPPEHWRSVRSLRDIDGLLDEEFVPRWKDFLGRGMDQDDPQLFGIFRLNVGGCILVFLRVENEPEYHVSDLSVSWSPSLQFLLSTHFALTPTEVNIVMHLTEHFTLDKFAQVSRSSKNTLRTQLRSIFKKLSVTSQPELLQRVAALSYFSEKLKLDDVLTDQTPPAPFLAGAATGADQLPLHMAGPADGDPLLFIHGMLDGFKLTPAGEAALEEFGFRLIAPTRPSFGSAAPLKSLNDPVGEFASQLRAVADDLDIENAVVLGHMSGGVVGFGCMPALGRRAKCLVSLSGGSPIFGASQFSALSKRQRGFAYTARFAPFLLPGLMKLGTYQIKSGKAESLMWDMYPAGSPDIDLLTRSDVKDIVLEGYEFAVNQGYRGFHADALLVTSDWSHLVHANTKPVLIMHGHSDPASDFESVKTFAEREGLNFKAYPHDGQLLLYGHPQKVLSEIRTFADQCG